MDEKDYYRRAVAHLVEKRVVQEFKRLKNMATQTGASKPEYESFIKAMRLIDEFAVETLYKQNLERYVLSGIIEKDTLHFVYYLCLRWNNDHGFVGIAADLKPFEFKSKEGHIEKRSGCSKLFQLEQLKDFSRGLRCLGLNSHTLLVADLDIYRFEEELESKLGDTLKSYIASIEEVLEGEVPITTQTEFFGRFNAASADYKDIFESIYKNDGALLPVLEVKKQLNRNQVRKLEFVANWSGERNKRYTAHTIARNIYEGIILSEQKSPFVISIFAKKATIGTEFNIGTNKRKVPFVCLPIYYDRIGNIKYA